MPAHPIAPQKPYPITQHGQTRMDEYYWMRERENPAVIEYLQAENDYLEEVMQHTKALQRKLVAEMKGRIKDDDASVPERQGEYFYYTRYPAGQQYPLYCRKHGSLEAPEKVLIDQNKLAEGKSFCRIGAFRPSPDHNKLAYSVDPDGSEKCTIHILDLTTGEHYPESIPNTYGDVYGHTGVEWAADNQTFFYVMRDAALRPHRIYRHVLGSDPAQDELVYEEADETFFLFLGKTRSQAYLTAYSRSTITTEWAILPANQPADQFQVFTPRQRGHEYEIEHHNERFYVLSNQDAQNFKLLATSQDHTGLENWQTLIPHRPEVLISDLAAFQDHLVLFERKEGLQQIRISAPDATSQVRYVPFPEPTYTVHPARNPEFKTDKVRFHYASLITPNSVIDFHMDSGGWELKKQDEIPSGHNPDDYVSERLHATAPDGTRVPVSLVYRRGVQRDRSNPTLLYGYGSYGYSSDPGFNANRFSLIDRGFVFAIGHIRGGSELGRAWYEDGKMLNKRNTFTDFIACAELLIAEGFTTSEHLAILGGSAGGLLVGACLTMRPELFKAVVAKVPFVDVVTTMSDPSIPLTTLEYDQWGNPDDSKYFEYMLSYSPYDNIQARAYPHVLITTGLNDPRVAYWEPAKFAARLRARKTDDNLLLLQTNMDAGHAGASGRYDYLEEVALDYAFLLDRLGVPEAD
ncbi:MAG: S9 family peptidase [Anaerolineales bacterium]|nr:S9 family peptidase [Anaerolineales bacterium]